MSLPFTNHAADIVPGTAIIEDQIPNEDERPLEDSGQEQHDDIYD